MAAKGYAKFESTTVQTLLQNPLVALATHWLFQSLFYMDKTERWFKLGLDFVGTAVLWLLVVDLTGFQNLSGLGVSFLLTHSLNFIFNGHIWGVLKHYGFVENSRTQFELYSQRLADRVNAEPSIVYGAVYGSQVRAEWKPSSDLDVRLVRRMGFWQGIRACWFVLRERSRAMWHRFPLDLYLLDSLAPLTNMRTDEKPDVIKVVA